jgi:hypothetical protein
MKQEHIRKLLLAYTLICEDLSEVGDFNEPSPDIYFGRKQFNKRLKTVGVKPVSTSSCGCAAGTNDACVIFSIGSVLDCYIANML